VKRRTAVLISGRGSNMEALIAASRDPAFPAAISLVLSNRPDAAGLATARQAGIAAQAIDHRDFGRDRAAHEAALDTALREADIEIVCLAGYMRLLTPFLVQAWQGRMLNIHPSLLPAFPGLHTHARALEAGVKLHGCTVHLVTQEMDAGPILAQAAVPVLPGDTEDDLARRVLRQEHAIYPAALAAFAAGRFGKTPDPASRLNNPIPWFGPTEPAAAGMPRIELPTLTPPTDETAPSFFCPVFWGASDQDLVQSLAKIVTQRVRPGYHFADNLLTWGRNNSMLDDKAFVRAWKSNSDSDADVAIVWRRYILACAACHAVQLDGDFVECGCYRGVGIKTVVDYLGGTAFPRRFWGYDLFEHAPGMAHHAMADHGPTLAGIVRAKFADYPQVSIVQGEIPTVLAGQSPARISYLHIDLNEAAAEIAALDALFDRVVPSGIIILDDYEWALRYRPQKLAEDPWFEARGYRVMPLPTGQGLVIKR
jgi:formyltetrahydrofolate-dependent phosphoribosylglycinamide formyltransferase